MSRSPKTDEGHDAAAAEVERLFATLDKGETPLPHYEEQLRKRRGGPYIIAPDSADPLPLSMWQGIDLDALDAAVTQANNDLKSDLTPEELNSPNPPLPVSNYMPRESRELLRRLDTELAHEVLARLEIKDGDSDDSERSITRHHVASHGLRRVVSKLFRREY